MNNWSTSFGNCGGDYQSPVNIVPEMIIPQEYPPIVFGNYNKMIQQTIYNNGKKGIAVSRTVIWNFTKFDLIFLSKVKLDSKTTSTVNRPYISGGGLPGTFYYEQLHFHWGLDSSRGSEHLIKSKRWATTYSLISFF